MENTSPATVLNNSKWADFVLMYKPVLAEEKVHKEKVYDINSFILEPYEYNKKIVVETMAKCVWTVIRDIEEKADYLIAAKLLSTNIKHVIVLGYILTSTPYNIPLKRVKVSVNHDKLTYKNQLHLFDGNRPAQT